MSQFLMTLRQREFVADRTMAFHFDKPAAFRFTAGQSLDLTLLTPADTDAEGDTRTFTIASAPQDPDIVIATRLRDSAFKRVFRSAPLGTPVRAQGPDRSFTLHEDAAVPAVLLAGGIGITPFRSIIRDAVCRRLPHQLWLFYSNHRPEDAAFLDELQRRADTTPSLHVIATMTDMAHSHRPWHGETKLIDRDLISSWIPLEGPKYYVAGPPAMVAAMRQMLTGARVRSESICTDEFDGY